MKDYSLAEVELRLLEAMEGRGGGAWHDLLRLAALAASRVFGLAVATRNALYDRGLLQSARSPLPVISVGNLTVGGTGKTPFVGYLASSLQRQGHRPAILARGYRAGGKSGVNDEMEMLLRQCPEVLTIPDPRRLAGSIRAIEAGADVALLDDGFQHRQLDRDLDILLIDATRPFGNGHLLPRGPLREPPAGAARAGLVVLTRTDLAGLGPVGELRTWLGRLRPGMPLVECSFQPRHLRPLTGTASGAPLPAESVSGRLVGAFAGLASPDGFGRTLRALGARLVYSRRFPDHHSYTPADLQAVAAEAASAGAEMIVTTEKDAVKIEAMPAPEVPMHCLTIETTVEKGEDVLWAAVGRALARHRSAQPAGNQGP